MRYLLDANVFIQAKNLHYGFDFCPAFWDWLIEQNAAGLVMSIEKVSDELRAGGDDLAAWAQQRTTAFFVAPDSQVVAALAGVSQWVTSQSYEPAAIATFLQVADYWLIGHALAHSCVVVTHEVPSESTRKVKIPNVCVGMGLSCVTPYECCAGNARDSCSVGISRKPGSARSRKSDSVHARHLGSFARLLISHAAATSALARQRG